LVHILFLFFFFSQTTYSIPESAHYFLDAKKLYDIEQTHQELFKHGFTKQCFTTKDHVKLCSFFLDKHTKENIKGTIIYAAGFYPGFKEGMCSFYSLIMDQPYNVLLFDARGHHESEGDFFSYSGIKNYGKDEYLDIIAAIEFVTNYNKKNNIPNNIIVHGICSGAYHSIKAINHMRQNNYPEYPAIKGIIFDSGWFKIQDIIQDVIYAEVEKRFKKSWFAWAAKPISFITYQIYNLLFSKTHRQLENIYESIQNINCPIFFVHCDKDPYVSITPVQEFTQKCNCKYVWWIPHDSHANYHMHNYQKYQDKLLEFLNILN
jgi:hypothetical protein